DRLEILIVDNHSCDDSVGIFRTRFGSDARVHVIEAPGNLGYGKGNTYGASYAQGDLVLIINPDNTVEPDFVEKMIAVYESDPTIGILAPKLVHEDGTVRDSFRSFPTFTDLLIKRTFLKKLFPERLNRYLRMQEASDALMDTDWVVGAV